jgi:hypothetical protein
MIPSRTLRNTDIQSCLNFKLMQAFDDTLRFILKKHYSNGTWV